MQIKLDILLVEFLLFVDVSSSIDYQNFDNTLIFVHLFYLFQSRVAILIFSLK
jgi:hypothetical protein